MYILYILNFWEIIMVNKKNILVIIMVVLILIICLVCVQWYLIVNNSNFKSQVINEINDKQQIEYFENKDNSISMQEKIDSENITIQEENEVYQENKAIEMYTKEGTSYKIIGKLTIPTLDIDYPIISETTDELLKISITKYWGANPNQVGNMVITGHNYKTTKFFSKLNKIKLGDKIYIEDLSGRKMEYNVYKTDIIDPYDNSCTSQKTNGNIEITLITCYNNDENRFIVKARV